MNPDSQHSRRGALALRLLALAAVSGLGAALTFGYFGRLHFAFDSFSHLRLHFAGLLLLLVPVLAALRLRAERCSRWRSASPRRSRRFSFLPASRLPGPRPAAPPTG